MDLSLDALKEDFSLAYLRALCAAAGFSVIRPERDISSTDLIIVASEEFHPGGARLDVQVKCHAHPPDEEFTFRLKKKNFLQLRMTPVLVARLLFVVVVPKEIGAWVVEHPEFIQLSHVAYWTSLEGQPETDHKGDKVPVRLTRKQTLTVGSLTELMRTLGTRGLPK